MKVINVTKKIGEDLQINITDDISVPPNQEVIFKPGDNLKNIENVDSGKTCVIQHGDYTAQIINVKPGVSIKGLGLPVINCTQPGNETGLEIGLFNFNSVQPEESNQSITGLVLRGGNIAKAGIIATNRNNISISSISISGFKFCAAWLRSIRGLRLIGFDFKDNSWCSVGWASGELCISNLSDFSIIDGVFNTTNKARGYAIKCLWPKGELNNGLILNNEFSLDHNSLWNNNKSRNISIETADTRLSNIIIERNIIHNQVSLASGYQNGGNVVVRDNSFFVEGDTYCVEALLDNFEFYGNNISRAQMMLANFQANKKWKNWKVYDNKFRDPSGVPSWGGVILIGASGVENVVLTNNQIPASCIPVVKYMGVTGGVTVS